MAYCDDTWQASQLQCPPFINKGRGVYRTSTKWQKSKSLSLFPIGYQNIITETDQPGGVEEARIKLSQNERTLAVAVTQTRATYGMSSSLMNGWFSAEKRSIKTGQSGHWSFARDRGRVRKARLECGGLYVFAVVYVWNCVIMVFNFCFQFNVCFFLFLYSRGIAFPPHRLFKGIDAKVFTQSISFIFQLPNSCICWCFEWIQFDMQLRRILKFEWVDFSSFPNRRLIGGSIWVDY